MGATSAELHSRGHLVQNRRCGFGWVGGLRDGAADDEVACSHAEGLGRGGDALLVAGIGIAPEDQTAVFEEFRQVGRSYTNKQEGTGLGLALTKKFVELHGGRIWVESEAGNGSTFTFTIPVQP